MKTLYATALILFSSVLSFNAAAADINAGKALVEKYNCASCHGKDYNNPIDPSYPRLAGQHQDYLEQSLIAYQRGGNAVNANGRANAIMAAQVKPLSRKDISDIAAYLHSLPGALVLRR